MPRSDGYKNIKPPQKGEVRNPNGRPKGSKDGLLAVIRRKLKNNPDENILAILKDKGIGDEVLERLKSRLVEDGVGEALAAVMLTGDVPAIMGYIRATEEPPKQTTGLDIEGQVTIKHIFEREEAKGIAAKLRGEVE